MGHTVWITGVNGFTGRHLVKFLRRVQYKFRIVGLDINAEAPFLKLDSFFQLDLNDLTLVKEVAQEEPPFYVFHLAALLPPAKEPDMWYVNVGGTVSLLLGLHKARQNHPRVVCVGSASEYLATDTGFVTEESPCGGETPHGRTKYAQTTTALNLGAQLGFDIVVARPFNLVGPGLPRTLVAGELCAQFSRPVVEEVRIGNIWSERDFIDVRDAVAAYWALAQKGTASEIYNVCSGRPTAIKTLVSIFAELTGNHPDIDVQGSRMRPVDLDRIYGSYEKIHNDTGWRPRISLRQSLADMLEEARS